MASCAATGPGRGEAAVEGVSDAMLLDASPLLTGNALQDLSSIDVLEMTREMTAFIDDNVPDGLSPLTRLKSLLNTVIGREEFELVYDGTTRTASETFEARGGNCLSFTNLFIAFARHLGLDASYQEVEIAPDWSLSGESFLLSQHVNVFIDFKQYNQRVVDFNFSYDPSIRYDFEFINEQKIISDARGRAHYFNNLGAESMLKGNDAPRVFSFLRESLAADDSFAAAWTNLGILYRREGYLDHAEAAYLRALNADATNMVAMSNLASLYEQMERFREAERFRERVTYHRMRNPYYRYALARNAAIDGDYASARKHLKYAISKRKNESRFHALMGVTYALEGERAAAQRWMSQAKELAGGEAEKNHYSLKLDRLMDLAVKH
jgi:tetratricopeptide (TPR) repeat protein